MKITKEIRDQCIALGSCHIPKIGTPIEEFTIDQLVWAEDNLKIDSSVPLWLYAKNSTGQYSVGLSKGYCVQYSIGDGYGYEKGSGESCGYYGFCYIKRSKKTSYGYGYGNGYGCGVNTGHGNGSMLSISFSTQSNLSNYIY